MKGSINNFMIFKAVLYYYCYYYLILTFRFISSGFALYYLKDPDSVPRPLDTDFFRFNRSAGRSKAFINLREISMRFKLPPGTYVIVPSTFNPNEAGEFILRIFTEKATVAEEN